MSTTVSSQAALQLMSPDFKHGECIGREFTGQGANKAPRLVWKDVPTQTKSLMLICDDPDAPGQKDPWVHWVVYNIPPDQKNLDYIKDRTARLENGTMQGANSWPHLGYDGPMPPASKAHRYFFKLYALDTMLSLEPKATKQEVLRAAQGHILAHVELMGLYKRL